MNQRCYLYTCGRAGAHAVEHQDHGRIHVCGRHAKIMVHEADVATLAGGVL